MNVLTVCLPAAAVIAAGVAFTAADRQELGKVGLCVVNGVLTEDCRGREAQGKSRARQGAGSASAPRIRQGGPVCYDFLLWPGDSLSMTRLPAMPAYAAPVGSPLPFLGLAASQGRFETGEFVNYELATIRAIDYRDYSNPVAVYDDKQTYSVSEPDSIAILAIGISILALVLNGATLFKAWKDNRL